MAKVGHENLQCDTGEYGQSTCPQKYQVQGKRVRWAAPFMLRLPGIIEVTAATSVEQPEFLVKEQRVWKDRVIPGPVEVSPLNPIRTNPINMECVDRAVSFEEHPKLPVAPYRRALPMPEPRARARPSPRYRVVDTQAFRDLVRAFEKADKDGNNRIDQVEFTRLIDELHLKGLSSAEIRRSFDAFDADRNGTIDFKEFFAKFEQEYVRDPVDSINNIIRDSILRTSGNLTSKDRYPAPGPVFVRESYEFRDLERDFERRGPRGRVTYFDFEDVVRSKTSRLSASRLRKAFDRMKIPNTDYIFYDEFLNLVGRNRTSTRADLIERFIVDAVLDLNV